MTFAREFYDWGALNGGMREDRYHTCSPNLDLIVDELGRRWNTSRIGCYNPVLIPGSAVWSTHAWGAAVDVRYYDSVEPGVVPEQIAGFLIGWSEELHVQAVHDYVRQRIWRAGRTASTADACGTWWKAQRTSSSDPMGKAWATWLHIETTRDGWTDLTPLAERGLL